MDSMKMFLAGWLSGLAVGLVLSERWRRSVLVPAAENVGEAVDTDTASTAMKMSADQPKVSAVIVAGAKADVERARQFLVRVTPWGSTSAPSRAQLRRSGQAAMPGTTPNHPA
jgi:hypothetical protein